jgi:DNA-binding PadR family transcriptional regulator
MVFDMPVDRKAATREILLGFWKVHILYHAAEGPVVGQWMIEELRRHGYNVSPGTMYPLLARMRRNGWLSCEVSGRGPRARRNYRLTREGAAVLRLVKRQLRELHHEAIEDHSPRRINASHRKSHVRPTKSKTGQ